MIINREFEQKARYQLCGFEPELTLIFTSLGASFLTSVSSRSPKPATRGKKVTQSAGDRDRGFRSSTALGCGQSDKRTFDQRRPSAEHDGGEERASEVHVGLLDGVGQNLVDARALVSDQVGSEEKLWRSEPGRPDLGGARSRVRGEFDMPAVEGQCKASLQDSHLRCCRLGGRTAPSLSPRSRPFAG